MSIYDRVLDSKRHKCQLYPCHVNRASALGHPCVKYLYLMRTAWDKRQPFTPDVQMRFEIGNVFESMVINDLMAAGIVVVEQQRPYSWDKYKITGHTDGKVQVDDAMIDDAPEHVKPFLTKGMLVPLEVKSASQFVYPKINSVKDMTESRYLYMRRYPAQLQLYMIMDSKEVGLFIFKEKNTGAMKEVWMTLDLGLCESLIKRAETVNEHVDAGMMPDPIDWDDDICERCDYLHICVPDRVGNEFNVIDDDEIIDLLERRDDLKAPASEYKKVDELLKKKLEGHDKVMVGGWLIQSKPYFRTVLEVPEGERERYLKKVPAVRRSIVRI